VTEQPTTPSPTVVARAVAARREDETRRWGDYETGEAMTEAVITTAEKYAAFLNGTTPIDNPASAEETPDGIPIVRLPADQAARIDGLLGGVADAGRQAG